MRVLYIDIDIPKELFEKYRLQHVLRAKVQFCTSLYGLEAVDYTLEPSSCGNLHLRVVLDRDVDPETYIVLKYCVGEDHKRLTHSIRRYEATGKILDFFWLSKVKTCRE